MVVLVYLCICVKLRMYSPFEQFELVSVVGLGYGKYDISFTNSSMILCMGVGVLLLLCRMVLGEGRLIPSRWQVMIEGTYSLVLEMVYSSVGGKEGGELVGVCYSLFMLILTCNLIGLIPYSYTVTAQLIVTFVLALGVFIGKLWIGISRHGVKLMGMFIPAGAPFGMVWFFVFVEIIGFVIPLISLSVRLFANMMSGHILLKVLFGFSFMMMMSGGMLMVLHVVPLMVLFLLIGLEMAVALIQAYVFTLLTCIYIGDMVKGGH